MVVCRTHGLMGCPEFAIPQVWTCEACGGTGERLQDGIAGVLIPKDCMRCEGTGAVLGDYRHYDCPPDALGI